MGFWGVHWQESDTYLDMFDGAMKRLNRIIDKEYSDNSIKHQEGSIVAACGLLLDIVQNDNLYYEPEQELVQKAIGLIDRVLNLCDFANWRSPPERKEAVIFLRKALEERHNKKERYTSLGGKLRQRCQTVEVVE